ncbi:succinate-semialdehyde dehydrogenase/glutarate-semialdehyde dehydrogenase [Halohasta litchfieldiae]|jgi:succinate-semialdehyde dehydrogenase/glutarate-semialdehyde dehydrogenase|uniref:Succinate-semialdehyde dehydrogenase / glutarate-semialdehyde dehydrogenase n=1 Tax=Halohasta litchfieldiae TaxID=1073996 RepID=A0A1H6RC58_9EURY|nr:succinic semialdehyde dehydrogenase [Halohasta litchfieldiae]ATW89743.1 succinate-semialdehyde dehydrogenase/glutarate-semialdehyde dehydrogenase [Halohasta litchfieldiae]SEI53428.1 succinate-semialdehyde dehydrogenase / glutarate-semialdehyde dehydrogenase [Halohasta litchfieldiae]
MSASSDASSTPFLNTALTADRLETLADRVDSASAETLTVTAPATTDPIGSVPACDRADVASAVEVARDAQSAWAATPVKKRAAVIDRFSDLVIKHREELLDLIQLESGKARGTAVEELFTIPSTCDQAVDCGPDAVADNPRSGGIPLLTAATVTYEPVGVVGVISPWNYPVTLAMADVIPALVAGNSVVLKPDEKTPYATLFLADLLEQAGLPADVLQIVTGEGSTVGPAVIDHVDYIAFTGGTKTGRTVAAQAGRNLIDCSLELGGKNPFLVLDDADVAEAARGAAASCFANAGQLCLAAERIYVADSIYTAFLDAFVDETRQLTLGTGYDYAADVGSLIDADQLDRVRSHVDDARESGATVQTGGRHRPDIAPYCYEPTILTDVDPEASVACEETFGPVVSVSSVPSTEAAIEAANDSPYGLNASVWTANRERGQRVARQVDCGTVCVNDGFAVGWGAVDAPMGGFGDSGLGRRHGPEGIKRYLEARTVAVSRVGPLAPPEWVPLGWAVEGLCVAQQTGRRLKRAMRSLLR